MKNFAGMAGKRSLEEDSMYFSDDDVDLPLLKRQTILVQPTKAAVEDNMFTSSEGNSDDPGAANLPFLNDEGIHDSDTKSERIGEAALKPAMDLSDAASSPASSEKHHLSRSKPPELVNLDDSSELADMEVHPSTLTLTTLKTATNFEFHVMADVDNPCPTDPVAGKDATPSWVCHEPFQGLVHGPAGLENTLSIHDSDSTSDSDLESASVRDMENEEQDPPRHCHTYPHMPKLSHSKIFNFFRDDSRSISPQCDQTVTQPEPLGLSGGETICCIIDKLVLHPFCNRAWSEEKRRAIVQNGRPTPIIGALNLTDNLFKRFSWLTACQQLKLVFCWPCVLFAKGRSYWRKGYKQSNGITLSVMCYKHEANSNHVAASDSLTKWVARELRLTAMHNQEIPSVMPLVIDLSQDSDDSNSPPDEEKARMKKNALASQPIPGMPQHQSLLIPTTEAQETHSRQTIPVVLPMKQPSPKPSAANPPSPEECIFVSEQPPLIPSSSVLIKRLQENHFVHGKWTDLQRAAIIVGGRPCPPIEGMIEQRFGPGTSPVAKHYCNSYYKKIPWLAGCSELAKLFCWPCLLFMSGRGVWTHEGFLNIKVDINWCAEKHALTQEHMEATLRLKMYERILKKQVDPSVELSPIQCSFTAKQKRELLRYVIDIACFFKTKSDNSIPPLSSDFTDLMVLISRYDSNLRSLLGKNSTESRERLKEVVIYADNVCSTIDRILKNRILKELEEAPFVSLILKSVADRSWIAVIVRYTSEGGDVFERFIAFVEAGDGLAAPLLHCIHETMAEIRCEMKLVGFSYDGAVLIPSEIQDFNDKMNEMYISSHFFPYWNFDFKTLIHQSLIRNPHCLQFFQKLNELISIFEHPSAAHNFAQMFYDENMKEIEDTFWEFSAGFVETIRSNYSLIIVFLQRVVAYPLVWRSNMFVKKAFAILDFLTTLKTRFLLVLISNIMATVDCLSIALQRSFEFENWKVLAQVAVSTLMEMRIRKFDEIHSAALNLQTSSGKQEVKVEVLVMQHDAVLEWVISFVKSWTKNIDSWPYFAADTMNCKPAKKVLIRNIPSMRKYFPLMDMEKLRPQINFVYGNAYFLNRTSIELLKSIADLDMIPALSELYKFLLLILTVPMTPYLLAGDSAVKRISTYASGKSAMKCADALVHMEKDLLTSMQQEDNFYDMILNCLTEHFDRKELVLVTPCSKRIIEIP